MAEKQTITVGKVLLLLAMAGLCIFSVYYYFSEDSLTTEERNLADLQEALKKAEAGDAEAQYTVGYLYANDNSDMTKAVEWWTRSAENNFAPAQLLLGEHYERSEQQNTDEAARWYQAVLDNETATEEQKDLAREALDNL